MTTMSFSSTNGQVFQAANRSPRTSFAARLAALQASQEQAPQLRGVFGVAGRFALAAVPVSALAWLFVFI